MDHPLSGGGGVHSLSAIPIISSSKLGMVII